MVVEMCRLLLTPGRVSFPADYVPTVFDNHNATLYHESQPVMLSLWDTAGMFFASVRLLLLCWLTQRKMF
jgi:hypothetical protein